MSLTKRGSVLLQVAVLGFVGIAFVMAAYKFIHSSLRQKSSIRARTEFVDLRNTLNVLFNNYCTPSTFKTSSGANFAYPSSAADDDSFSLDRVFFGTDEILRVGQVRHNFRADAITLTQNESVAANRKLVIFHVEGRLIRPDAGSAYTTVEFDQKIEIALNASQGVDACFDRATYFETAVATRTAFSLQNIGCDADTLYGPAYNGVPAFNSLPFAWSSSSQIYRRSTPSTKDGPLELAIVAGNNCSPYSGQTCATSCLMPTSTDPSAPSTPPLWYQPLDPSKCSYSAAVPLVEGLKIPVESFRSPANNSSLSTPYSNRTSGWGCTGIVDPSVPTFCLNYSRLGGGPMDMTAVASIDHPEYNPGNQNVETPVPSTLWTKFFPVRNNPAANPIDPITSGPSAPPNPPRLATNEKRCWVRVVDKTSKKTNADKIFFVPPGRTLSIGCRISNPYDPTDLSFQPWQLMGCFRTHQSRDGAKRGDNDIYVSTTAEGSYCGTNDHTQPHVGGVWSEYLVRVGAICGHIIKDPGP